MNFIFELLYKVFKGTLHVQQRQIANNYKNNNNEKGEAIGDEWIIDLKQI